MSTYFRTGQYDRVAALISHLAIRDQFQEGEKPLTAALFGADIEGNLWVAIKHPPGMQIHL